jgi:hypothetical protein
MKEQKTLHRIGCYYVDAKNREEALSKLRLHLARKYEVSR